MDNSRECPVNVTHIVLNFITRESPLFFGAFAKLRKATISFVMSVHLSVCHSVRSRGKIQLPLDEFL